MNAATFYRDIIAEAEKSCPQVRDNPDTARRIMPHLVESVPRKCKLTGNRKRVREILETRTLVKLDEPPKSGSVTMIVLLALIEALLRWWLSDRERGTEILKSVKGLA